MNPLKIQEKINNDLAKQLRFTYPVDAVCRGTSIAENLKRLFPVGDEPTEDRFSFVNASYIESIPQYQVGESLAELVQQDVLHESTALMVSRYFGSDNIGDVTLYHHQSESIKAVNNGKNLVVCTGTGSGKTESFLIPVLDAIVRERIEKGPDYVTGVRAMILYPMNALVNDQVLRIRNFIKAATGIPGAKDITYGKYTGDVATIQKESRLRELPQGCVGRINAIEGIHAEHPYFSDDSVPSNEYTRRSRWINEGGADILITNYSMLERLMLNPDSNPIFSESWRFIILDEAHTYDGSMGTEISWLLKRLSKRVGVPENPLQYLATSATLFAAEDDVEGNVRNQFASKIFPAEPESFSVQMGKVAQPTVAPCNQSGEYRRLISTKGTDLNDIVQKLPGFLKPKEEDAGDWKLFDQYKWAKEASRCIDSYSYIDPKNIKERMALGDLVYLTTLLSSICPNQKVSLQCADFAGVFAAYGRANVRKAVTSSYNVYGIAQDEYRDTIIDLLRVENKNDISLPLSHVKVLASAITTLLEKCDLSQINELMVSEWPVKLSQDTVNALNQYANDLEQLGKDIKEAQTKIYNCFIDETKEKGASVEEVITSYFKNHAEFGRLVTALQEKGYEEYSALSTFVVGEKRDDEFDSFCQLLAVTRAGDGGRKPLVDLRIHQSVRGLFQLQVQFDITDGKVCTKLLPNENSIVNGAGERIFPLACCNHCGHPYIFVYTKERNLRQARAINPIVTLSNYQSSEYKYLQALTWEPGEHKGVAELSDAFENTMWLEYKKGMLHLVAADAYPHDYHLRPNDFIKIYRVGNSRNAANTRHISKCPACGSTMTRGGDYTLLSPYRLSEKQARVFILRTLTQCSEDDMFPDGKPAGGKKVISFADSRTMAAHIPVDYDEITRYKLMDYIVYHAVKTKAADGISSCSIKKEGDDSIVGCVFEAMQRAVALELLNESYIEGDNIETDFEQADVIVQLVSKTLRGGSHRGLIKRGYLKIKSSTQDALERNEKWEDFVEKCEEFVNVCEGLYNDIAPETLAQKLFEEVYNYLFLKGELRFDNDYGKHAAHYAIDARNTNGAEQSNILGMPIYKSSPFAGNEEDNFSFLNYGEHEASRRIKNWINKHADETEPNDQNMRALINDQRREIAEALCECFLDLGILIQPAKNTKRYYFNVGDVRFELAPNQDNNLLFDDHLFCRIEEHSGQIANDLAAYHQSLFSKGFINILSCSTTFEMGVDLGSLNTVFLCSMPPSVANYRQRAGRAGRRAGSTAYVLTFMGEASHDSNYHSHPEKLFFGQVSSPVIYTDISSYRAKHLRAEALRHFLEKAGASWSTCGSFFGAGGENQGLLAYMNDWYERYHSEVQEICENVCGSDLDYSVAADLCFQLTGSHAGDIGIQNYLLLAGPCIEAANAMNQWDDFWKSPLQYRYHEKRRSLSTEQFHNTPDRNQRIRDRVLRRMDREDTAGYLASSRVLPRYGFPCDTVELIIEGLEKEASLSRDKAIGIREYAVGCTVLVNKKKYTSTSVRDRGYMQGVYVQADALNLYRCECGEVFSCYQRQQQVICPGCRREVDNNRKIKLTQPDYFIGRPFDSNRDDEYNPQSVDVFYGGGAVEACVVGNTSLKVSTSATREILYVNTTENQQLNAPWLCYALRTDIVLWSYNGAYAGGKLESLNAWWSALQAVLKAIAEVLNVNMKDVSGLISHNPDGGLLMVIYDSSTSGAGSVLPLMPGNREEDIEIRILKKALDICKYAQCDCKNMPLEVAQRETVSDSEYMLHSYECRMQNVQETKRPRKACYECIMSYSNRHLHSKLDTYDASVIIEAMLGPNAPGIDDGRPSNHNGATGGGRNSKADATTGADNAGDRSETEQGRDAASSNEAIHFPVGKPVSEVTPQRFISIETNKSLCKKLRTKRNEYFYVLVNGEVIKDKLTSVLQEKRAVFEKSGDVRYSNIMEIK